MLLPIFCALAAAIGPTLLTIPAGLRATLHRKSNYAFRYFDKNGGGKCKSFTFGGCEGNGNRFSSQEECESVCFLMEEVPSLEGSDIEDSKLAICKLEVDEGPCDETLQRWYFDIKSSTCRPFIFGGCAGNRYVLENVLFKVNEISNPDYLYI